MMDKIKQQFKGGFVSSPVGVTSKEISLILKHDCQCSRCGESLFELEDFPALIEKDELLCEYCYDEEYRDVCNVCEEYYDIRDNKPDYFFVNKYLSGETGQDVGIYKVLKRPFYYGSVVSGFESFFERSIKLVLSIDIEKYLNVGSNDHNCTSGFICPECENKFLKEELLSKIERPSTILYDKYRDDFKYWTLERIKGVRQRLIHERINEKGMIEYARNKIIEL